MNWRLISIVLIPLALIIWESTQKKNPDAVSKETDIPDSEKSDALSQSTAEPESPPKEDIAPEKMPQSAVTSQIFAQQRELSARRRVFIKQRDFVTKEGIHISPVTLSWLQRFVLKLGESAVIQTGMVTKYGGKFEEMLKRCFGAQGKGLGEKINSVEEQLPPDLIRKLREIASVRGKFVHNAYYRFPTEKEMRAFFHLADEVRQGIEKCDKMRRRKQ